MSAPCIGGKSLQTAIDVHAYVCRSASCDVRFGRPISERVCARCSSTDATLEVRDHALGAALYFCGPTCMIAYPAADWTLWVKSALDSMSDALAPPTVDHTFGPCPEQGPCLAGLGKDRCHDLADGRPCGKPSGVHLPSPRQAALGAVEEAAK